MRSLSNNRNNAIGPWYVNANNGPSNANANNWGCRTSPQRGKTMLCQKNITRCLLNQPLIKGDSGRAQKPLRRKALRNLIEVFLGHRDGLPIGAGYSAMIANMVLAPLDRIIESHKGYLGYGRNLDNGTFITKSKAAAHDMRRIIEDWCAKRGLSTHEWALFPVGHHAVERGGWRIEDGRILAGAKVTQHILRIMRKPWNELGESQMLALASLYGYIKHGGGMSLKDRWKRGGYGRIFKAIGVSEREAATNRIQTERKKA